MSDTHRASVSPEEWLASQSAPRGDDTHRATLSPDEWLARSAGAPLPYSVAPQDPDWAARKFYRDQFGREPSPYELETFMRKDKKDYYEKNPNVRRPGETAEAFQIRQETPLSAFTIGAGYATKRRYEGLKGTVTGKGVGKEKMEELTRASDAMRTSNAATLGQLAVDIPAELYTARVLGKTPLGRVAASPTTSTTKRLAALSTSGGLQGLLSGTQMPAEDFYGTLQNVGMMGATGAIIPLAVGGGMKLGEKVRNLFLPYTKKGVQISAGNIANTAVGQDNVPGTIATLRRANAPGMPAVRPTPGPYTYPTATQALEQAGRPSAGLAGLENQLMLRQPAPFNATVATQQAGRTGMLGSFGGPQSAVQAAQSVRDAEMRASMADVTRNANLLRASRETSFMPSTPVRTMDAAGMTTTRPGVTPALPAAAPLEKLKSNPAMQSVMDEARNRARRMVGLEAEHGIPDAVLRDIIDDPTKSVEGLKLIRATIKDGFNKTAPGTVADKIDERTLTSLSKTFDKAADTAAPGWAQARQQYGKESANIFNMRVGQEAQNRLTGPLDVGQDRSMSLAAAVDSQRGLVREAGGMGRLDLYDQLSPEAGKSLDTVLKQLAIDKRVADLRAVGNTSESVKQALGKEYVAPDTLNREMTYLRSLWTRVSGAGQLRSVEELAYAVQNPQTLAKLMEMANNREKKALRLFITATRASAPATAITGQEISR